MGLHSYDASVRARAWRDWVAFLKAQNLISLVVAVLTTLVTGKVSAEIGGNFNTSVAVYAALVAAAAVAQLGVAGSLATAPWRLHEELATRLSAFERRPDVGRLVELHEQGVQLLRHQVPIVARDYRSDEELRATLAADNQELLVYQMKRRYWEEDTAAELEKCAARSEVSSFKTIESEVVALRT